MEEKKGCLKRLAFLALLVVFSLLLLELGCRVIMVFRLGPTVLLYGTRWERQVQEHFMHSLPKDKRARWDDIVATTDPDKEDMLTADGAYAKYPPHSIRPVYAGRGQYYDATINNHGFRGADFSTNKAAGTARIVTLGASATFGYWARDHETFPARLQEYLNDALTHTPCGDIRAFEVYNLGIPHLNSAQLHTLLVSEGFPYQPDVVAFYEGVNDTRVLTRPPLQRALIALAHKSVLGRFIEQVLWENLQSFSEADVARLTEGKPEGFIRNVAKIAAACRERGILFVLVLQQSQSVNIPRKKLAETTYGQEEQQLRARLARGERLDFRALQFLIHTEIMRRTREWALAEGVSMVDLIAAMDAAHKRYCLRTWVHFTPEGNEFAAGEIAREILARLCGN